MSPVLAVFVVDDNAAVRDSLSYLFRSVGLTMRGYPSAEEFLREFDATWSGCLVLDVRMPGMSGVELQARLRERGSTLPIIFLTGHGDVPMAVQAMQHGAVDFLEKPVQQEVLVDRVRKAIESNDGVRETEGRRAAVLERMEGLTSRQREVLDLLVAGESNREMAFRLGVSEKTIEFHRAKVMNKMQARNLAHLLRMVMFEKELG